MATATEIQAGRRNDGMAARRHLQATGLVSLTHRQYGGAGVLMGLVSDSGDGDTGLKHRAIDEALRVLAAQGFELPKITFVCTALDGIPCVAYMGNVSGQADYTVFLGPKTGQHEPQVESPSIVGGTGRLGQRGIADQQYDGSQRGRSGAGRLSHAATMVIHEIGHILHERNAPAQFWDYKRSLQAHTLNVRAAEAGLQVSEYAMRNPLEFVAETFAGCLCGKVYGPGVLSLYGELGGALPPGGHF